MNTFTNNTIASIEFSVTWEKDSIHHEEWFLGRKINPVNDVFPQGMREALEGKTVGESVSLTYEPRHCIPRHKESLVITRPIHRLRKKTLIGRPIIPLEGRFYPQGHIDGLLDIYPDTLTPFRMLEVDEEEFTADRNHPLANIPITITCTIASLTPRETGTYGSLTHWREKTCDWGPGMQARLEGEPTDFFHPAFFDIAAPAESPFSPPPMDKTAQENLAKLHARFITPQMRVLDFSLGSDRPEGKYDAAICTLSVEYMDRPVDIIRYVSHFLNPGAPLLIAFTNHYDEDRVIQGWIDLHEFERMGLVMEYLHMAKVDDNAGTISIRNDWRNTDDPLFHERKGISDPVYFVYGQKR